MADITHLDPRLLLAFIAISEERSVTGAARRLNMTQQGMSGTLARLQGTLVDWHLGKPVRHRSAYRCSPV